MKKQSNQFRDTLVIDFLVERKFRVWRHLVFLLFFFVLLYNARFWHDFREEYDQYVLIFVYVALLVMTYINIYVLVPLFFFRTRYILYFILLIILGVVGLKMISLCFNTIFSGYRISEPGVVKNRTGLYEGIMMCIPIILISTTLRLVQKWTRDNVKLAELSNLTLMMELNELRNQINPHFLFNMLNNVKALIRTDPDKASAVIVKLSEFLRYQLYENNEEKTLLTSEIDFLSNFINLEKIRSGYTNLTSS
ncbi:sensor histidine kinase [Epilithonimonas tenax]|uniref:sensor histidine kinase n=1 Tax=Epilithonimonas tenax TaxID=191577 RepID=UPI001E49E3A6|nr:histidine kinase [Epilithonimonas tenax]